jgi:hypothetical protein
MTVGSPTVNTLEQAKEQKGLRYTCLQTILTRGSETPDFPAKPCPAGIMASMYALAIIVYAPYASLHKPTPTVGAFWPPDREHTLA